MTFSSAALISANAAYSVVVLPEPVGPVTSTMPAVRPKTSRKRLSMAGGMPMLSSLRMAVPCSSKRMTADSPKVVGSVLRRTSIVWSFRRTVKRPSCGRRFSEMSNPAISFKRWASAPPMRLSAWVWVCKTPSTRTRICRLFSCGSMCTSDAPTCTASSNRDCSKRTTGAPSMPTVAVSSPKSTASPMSFSSARARPLISSVRR